MPRLIRLNCAALALTSVALVLLCGCSTPSVSTAPAIAKRRITCDLIYSERDFFECLERAKAGDAKAAFRIAQIYDKKHYRSWGPSIKEDRATALHWYKVAADLGHEEALRTVFDGYYFGRYAPENKMEAERYLKHAANLKHEWAMLVLAYWSEKSDAENAVALYSELARKDDCFAQRNLSRIYFEGKIMPQDLCKAYFWGLLASSGGIHRESDYHFLAGDRTSSASCVWGSIEKSEAERELSPEHVQLVQNAASRWAKGQPEPDFPIVQSMPKEKPIVGKISPPSPQDYPSPTIKERLPGWSAAQIDLNRQFSSNLSPSEVFNLVNPSVWTVISASSSANLKAMNNISLASAVAISEDKLLTNYHVIDERPYVAVKHGEKYEKARIVSGDKETDRCILQVENVKLRPMNGFKRYDKLAIGEAVYSIGSPKGLENTLGEGIISGKRALGELKMIQTTAQISKGSSGGGLFDRFGNLIGITTFKMADSEGLNFAISVEDFTQ